MPCHHLGPNFHVCSRGRRPRKRCADCGELAVCFCDFPVRRAGKAATCDRPLCRAHRKHIAKDVDHCLVGHASAPVQQELPL